MRAEVEQRAGRRCEYCQAPQDICAYTFHIEHIVPSARGGKDELNNYALACFSCNNAKRAHLSGIDPKTRKAFRLFNPRIDKWSDHFEWRDGFTRVHGKTSIGRATISRLKMNKKSQTTGRHLWIMTETWP